MNLAAVSAGRHASLTKAIARVGSGRHQRRLATQEGRRPRLDRLSARPAPPRLRSRRAGSRMSRERRAAGTGPCAGGTAHSPASGRPLRRRHQNARPARRRRSPVGETDGSSLVRQAVPRGRERMHKKRASVSTGRQGRLYKVRARPRRYAWNRPRAVRGWSQSPRRTDRRGSRPRGGLSSPIRPLGGPARADRRTRLGSRPAGPAHPGNPCRRCRPSRPGLRSATQSARPCWPILRAAIAKGGRRQIRPQASPSRRTCPVRS